MNQPKAISSDISLSVIFRIFFKNLERWATFTVQRRRTTQADWSAKREFENIIMKNEALIKKICFYYSTSLDEYNDLYQDIMVNIWRGFGEFREECRRSTWIYRVSLNTCVSSWRKNSRYSNSISIDKIVEPTDEYDADQMERIDQLKYLISCLSITEKTLIMMWLDGQSYDEISEITGFNRNTVATKLRRIKEKLTNLAKKEYNL